LGAAGVIDREDGQLRQGKLGIILEPNPVLLTKAIEVPIEPSRLLTCRIRFAIDIGADELLTWEDARQAEFFGALSQLTRAVKSGQARMSELSSWVTEAEAAERLNTSPRTLRRMAEDGELQRRYRQVSGRRPEPVFDPREIDAFVEKAAAPRRR
jgi:hypothetical protein